MPFKPGESGNFSGRKRGSKNRNTADIKQWVNDFVIKQTASIQKDWKSLKPEQRVILWERFLKYVLPQQTQISAQIDQLSDEQVDELYEKLFHNLTTQTDGK